MAEAIARVLQGTTVLERILLNSNDDDAIINFKNVVLASGQRLIRGIGMDSDAVTGWIALQGDFSGAVQYAAYMQPETETTTALLGLGVTCIANSGAAIKTGESAQLHYIVKSGAGVVDRAGDAVGGIHNVWAKTLIESGGTFASGGRVAPIWSDIQINGLDVSAEEVFHFFATAGGSRARSLIRHEGIADKFYESDAALGDGFQVASGYESTQGNDPAGFFVVDLNGTLYGIPLMATS